MIVTTQITKDYYDKCKDFIASLDANYPNYAIGCIDFTIPDCNFYTIKSDNLLYNGYSCSTRSKYVCLQHGEFMDWLNVSDDEVILNIDADVIIQDKLPELKPKDGELLVTRCAYPSAKLYEVVKNKRLKANYDKLSSIYNLQYDEFSAAVICATAKTWKDFYKIFKSRFEHVKLIDHHAAGMFIMNCIAYEFFDVTFLDDSFHNATWFNGTKTHFKDGWLMLEEEKVKIIHTKFEGEWRY